MLLKENHQFFFANAWQEWYRFETQGMEKFFEFHFNFCPSFRFNNALFCSPFGSFFVEL